MRGQWRSSFWAAAPAIATLLIAGCQAGYYAQLARGQFDLLAARQPIAEVIASDDADAALKARLRAALAARAFATKALALPDNGSYTVYADLHRPYVLWNVFATPELSLAPKEWCYLLVGCLSYRGYFDQAQAARAAAELTASGMDVHLVGVPAYSTLGWFDDPVLNTMLRWTDDVLSYTIFHELAHQQLFVAGDTAFNESFASFVGEQGLRQYLADRPELAQSALTRRERQDEFVALVLETRARLETLYASAVSHEAKRLGKQAEFRGLREGYAGLKAAWGGPGLYDAWMEEPLNNARLLPFGLYHQWVPAFAALFREAGRDWPAFYLAAEELSDLKPGARLARLQQLLLPLPTGEARERSSPG